MSILNVEHLSHGFGDREIFRDVSFRLLKGEHIGLVGANGEGKSTFMSVVTGKMQPDAGKVEWAKNVKVGYLDQHAVLEKGMTIRTTLQSAYASLFELEQRMNDLYMEMGDPDKADKMDEIMEEKYRGHEPRFEKLISDFCTKDEEKSVQKVADRYRELEIFFGHRPFVAKLNAAVAHLDVWKKIRDPREFFEAVIADKDEIPSMIFPVLPKLTELITP